MLRHLRLHKQEFTALTKWKLWSCLYLGFYFSLAGSSRGKYVKPLLIRPVCNLCCFWSDKYKKMCWCGVNHDEDKQVRDYNKHDYICSCCIRGTQYTPVLLLRFWKSQTWRGRDTVSVRKKAKKRLKEKSQQQTITTLRKNQTPTLGSLKTLSLSKCNIIYGSQMLYLECITWFMSITGRGDLFFLLLLNYYYYY